MEEQLEQRPQPNKSRIKIPIIISVFILFIVIVGVVFKAPVGERPCGYTNFAWGATKTDCVCLGIKTDTSCKTPSGGPCPDAGGSTLCKGVVLKRMCYEFLGMNEQHESDWNEISCPK